ncbi:hypothetical protein [Dyadobacter sp. CY323]|uniref:hypothetical protein n=1 Tax=Dyadobacter sp. CY323 TaxID=2907302 RepID=UPI001F45AF78|nr:hypothetical protein [Dyadobacter sp. CY323]
MSYIDLFDITDLLAAMIGVCLGLMISEFVTAPTFPDDYDMPTRNPLKNGKGKP